MPLYTRINGHTRTPLAGTGTRASAGPPLFSDVALVNKTAILSCLTIFVGTFSGTFSSPKFSQIALLSVSRTVPSILTPRPKQAANIPLNVSPPVGTLLSSIIALMPLSQPSRRNITLTPFRPHTPTIERLKSTSIPNIMPIMLPLASAMFIRRLLSYRA